MKMSKKGNIAKFVTGALVGAGIGMLFAPKKGSELRNDLKEKIDHLLAELKNIDKDEVKKEFDKKISELKKELADLDKEKALEIAKKKGEELKKKAQELVDMAVEKGTPVLRDAAEDVRKKAIAVTKDVLKKLEEKK